MFDILFVCFHSINFWSLLLIVFIIYVINNKSRNERINMERISIESVPRRFEGFCHPAYPNGWLPIFDSGDIKRGQVRAIFALGRDLVLFRGTSGKVYLFDAYCPHLGANLGVGGTVVGEDIKCHFHGWQFDNQGQCVSIPGLEERAIPKVNIKKWRCVEWGALIYVWHHTDKPEPDWHLPKEDILEQYLYLGQTSANVRCSLQDTMENASDWLHLQFVHGTTNVPILSKLFKLSVSNFKYKVCKPDSHCIQAEFILNFKLGYLSLPSGFVSFQIFGPACSTLIYETKFLVKFKILMNFATITVKPTEQLMIFKMHVCPKWLGLVFYKSVPRFMKLVIRGDEVVFNHRNFEPKPVYTKLDESIIFFRRWYKQFYPGENKTQ